MSKLYDFLNQPTREGTRSPVMCAIVYLGMLGMAGMAIYGLFMRLF